MEVLIIKDTNKSLMLHRSLLCKGCFFLIIEDANESDNNDKKFVIDYFKKTYIKKYNIKEWDYYKVYDLELITHANLITMH